MQKRFVVFLFSSLVLLVCVSILLTVGIVTHEDVVEEMLISASSDKVIKPANPKAIAVGLPLSIATSSLTDYFNCGNTNTGQGRYTMCIKHNLISNNPPFDDCGDEIDVYVQPGDVNEDPRKCFLPQIDMLEYIHTFHSNITFILSRQDPAKWLSTISNAGNFRERLLACSFTDLAEGNDEDLLAWYENHINRIRAFVAEHPSHKLIEFDVNDDDVGHVLQEAFGIPASCYVAQAAYTPPKVGAPQPVAISMHGWYAQQPRVPFYIHEVHDYDLCLFRHDETVQNVANAKHGGEYHFLEELRKSPWRAANPRDAELFIIPLLIGVNNRHKICEDEFDAAWSQIQSTPWFSEHNGANHVWLSTDYESFISISSPRVQDRCPSCILALQEQDSAGSGDRGLTCNVAAPMHGKLSKGVKDKADTVISQEESSDEFWSRHNKFWFAGQADKGLYHTRRLVREAFEMLQLTFITIPSPNHPAAEDFNAHVYAKNGHILGTDEKFVFQDEMRGTIFGLHIEGDRPGSSRLWEAMQSGSILVIASDEFYETGYPMLHVPWLDISVKLNMPKTRDDLPQFISDVKALLARDPEELWKIRSKMLEYKSHLLWSDPHSVVGHSVLLDIMGKCGDKVREMITPKY